jgi:UDP-N-acetylglucosamine 2-epimerase (non-hydrolysing)
VIYSACRELLTDAAAYEKMSRAANPYGDGLASVRIADILEKA